eukprot:518441_1
MPSGYDAVVDTKDNIHILGGKHYSISISSVLKDILGNEEEEEKRDPQTEDAKKAKEDHAKAIRTNDDLRKQNAHLQSLVEDLLNNNKTEELKEALKTNDKLR